MSSYEAKLKTGLLRAALAEEQAVLRLSTRTDYPGGYRSVVWLDGEEHLHRVAEHLRAAQPDIMKIFRGVRDDDVARYTALIVFWYEPPGLGGVEA